MASVPVLVQYWHEPTPPGQVAEALASFKAKNPAMEQLVFDESSAKAFIAEHCGGREAAAFDACAVPAMQADYFRYCAVYALGGVYADANFVCRGSLAGMIEGSERGTLFARGEPVPATLATMYNWPYAVGQFRAVTNGLFGFRSPDHPLLGLAVQAATANIEDRVADGPVGVWVAAGPGIFTSIYLLWQLGSIDAFIEYSVGSVIEPSARLLCEVVDDYTRIARMWGGVRIRPLERRGDWAIKARRQGGPGAHWLGTSGSIYR